MIEYIKIKTKNNVNKQNDKRKHEDKYIFKLKFIKFDYKKNLFFFPFKNGYFPKINNVTKSIEKFENVKLYKEQPSKNRNKKIPNSTCTLKANK